MEKSYASLRQLDHHNSSPVRIYRNREPDDYPAHWHPQYEIILPVEENYYALVEDKTYEVYPGDVLVIPAGMVHEIFAPPSGLRYIFMVDQEVILSTEGMAAVQHFFYPCVHLRGDRDMDLLEEGLGLLREAMAEYHPDKVYAGGISMGGYGTWYLLTHEPDLFAGGIPICGGGNPDLARLQCSI